jgi:hypothetical protein
MFTLLNKAMIRRRRSTTADRRSAVLSRRWSFVIALLCATSFGTGQHIEEHVFNQALGQHHRGQQDLSGGIQERKPSLVQQVLAAADAFEESLHVSQKTFYNHRV